MILADSDSELPKRLGEDGLFGRTRPMLDRATTVSRIGFSRRLYPRSRLRSSTSSYLQAPLLFLVRSFLVFIDVHSRP